MKNKGFTLIELLAVIVILAIIALIATPIILNIINSSKAQSNSRSIELYKHSFEQAIARKNLTGVVTPGEYTTTDGITLTHSTTGETITLEYNGNRVICETNIINNDGTVTLSGCTVSGESVSSTDPTPTPASTICTAVTSSTTGNVPAGNYALGDEYICNVDGTNSYHFFILSTNKNASNEVESVNLIMNRNICSDGTEATASNTCLMAWGSKTDYNDDTNYGSNGNNNKGPITVMNYLHTTTSGWSNVENIVMNYTDEGGMYGTIKTTGTTTSITMKDNTTVTATYTNLKARLPMESEVTGAGCTKTNGSCPLWLADYLKSSESYPTTGGKTEISGINGYWMLSSDSINSRSARSVYYYGFVIHFSVNLASYYGLRPVITVSKSNLS